MIVIGLTGGIGMGKTTAANMLRDMGIPVHCSDEAVASLYGRKDVAAEICALFPAACDGNGGVDRARLRKEIYLDHEKLDALEKILHPPVVEEQRKFLLARRTAGVKIAALDIPLLFETGADKRVDFTICLTAPAFMQEQRVLSRPGMTKEAFDFIKARQMPDEEKKRRADYIVQTGQGFAQTRRELAAALRDIRGKRPENGCAGGPGCRPQ